MTLKTDHLTLKEEALLKELINYGINGYCATAQQHNEVLQLLSKIGMVKVVETRRHFMEKDNYVTC